MSIDLPEALRNYFAIGNGADAALLTASFSPEAVVHDERHEHRGLAAIAAWIAATRQRYDFHAEPLSMDRKDNDITVVARVTGNFPGSPAQLTYRFALTDGLIASLEIG